MLDDTLKSGFLAAIERQLNAIVALDPVTLDRLSGLVGSAIELRCLEPQFHCYILPEEQHLRLSGYHEGAVDVVVSGSAVTLIALAKSKTIPFDAIEGLSVTGQPSLVDQLQSIHNDVDLDWERLIIKLLGGVSGHGVAQGMRCIGQQFHHGKQAFDRNCADYLQEELKLIPGRVEAEYFAEQVCALRHSVEKLSQQLNTVIPSESDSSNI